jgi:hypothetical protein
LGVVGGLVPYPVPLPSRCRFAFHVQALRPDGAIAFERRGKVVVTYWHFWLWSAASQDCAGTVVLSDLEMHVFDELARALGAP